MFAMVVEFADLSTMATTPGQRKYFMNNSAPPKGWNIWVGHYKGTLWRGVFNHFGLGNNNNLVDLENIPHPSALRPWFPAQSTAWTIGSLFFQTFSVEANDAVVNPIAFGDANGVRCLWPRSGTAIIEVPERVLDDNAADLISRSFVPADMRPFVRPAWFTLR